MRPLPGRARLHVEGELRLHTAVLVALHLADGDHRRLRLLPDGGRARRQQAERSYVGMIMVSYDPDEDPAKSGRGHPSCPRPTGGDGWVLYYQAACGEIAEHPLPGHPTNVDAADTLRLAQAWLDEVDAENAD